MELATRIVSGQWDGIITVRHSDTLISERFFAFDNEQIGSASASDSGDRWLFKHHPRWSEGGELALPYLTLWNWPLIEPEAKITPGFDSIYAAALAPTGLHIAVVGYDRQTQSRELRIIGLNGRLLSHRPVVGGGTGSSTRWSRDSTLVGTVGKGQYHVFSAPDLNEVLSVAEEYPSDLGFFADGTQAVLGSWTRTTTIPVPRREA